MNSISESAITMLIEKEDYCIADVIHRELLNVKHVKFAGVPPPHPLIKTLTIQVHTDGAKPTKAVLEAIDLCQKKVSELLASSKGAFPTTSVTSSEASPPSSENATTPA